VVAKTDPARLAAYGQERGWCNLQLLSSRNNTFNRDYHGETPEGEQLPVLNVFSRDADGIHHRRASELTFVRGDNSPLDPIWPIWGVLADNKLPTPRCSTSRSHPWIKPDGRQATAPKNPATAVMCHAVSCLNPGPRLPMRPAPRAESARPTYILVRLAMIPAAGGAQQRYSVGLVAEGFEGPVESGRLVRPRTTHRRPVHIGGN
jgi:hypothetical protein